jgi:nitrogenase molybdenum-iron protein alpha/beta subunit
VVERIPRGVNLVGVSIGHFNWENDLEELRRNLGALGAQVLATVTAGSSLGDLRRAPAAALTVVVHEEYGDDIAREMERLYGTPWVGIEEGAPFGLEGVEAWLGAVADRLGLLREPVLEESKGVRRRLYSALARASTLRGFPKGFSFALGGNASTLAAWLPFLHRYLGLYPVLIAVHEVGERSLARLRSYLEAERLEPPVLLAPDQLQLRDALRDVAPQVILGSTIERMLARSLWSNFKAFVEISFPVFGRVTLTHRPLAGLRGPLALVEDLLNRSGAILSAAI